jgi:TetR/AcrR family transcriptional repressor of nem operon
VARPRGFSTVEVTEAAKELFWEQGYVGTGLTDLESSTGLNRSSLYQAFQSKEGVFQGALAAYVESFVNPRLAPMERAGAGLQDIEGYFRGLAVLFRDDPGSARRGCLWVNSIAEFAGRPDPIDVRAMEFRDRLHAAFLNALTGGRTRCGLGQPPTEPRARRLVASTFGVWVLARIDPGDAARACDGVRAEVRSWRLPSPGQTRPA